MTQILDTIRWAPIAGASVLIYFLLAKFSVLRFRKRAVEVSGEVMEIFGHRQHTSYFIKYEYDGATRVAEYSGLPLVREFKVGDHAQIMIDGTSPPDAGARANWRRAVTPGGNCQLPGQPLISLWDAVVVGVCIYLIAKESVYWLR